MHAFKRDKLFSLLLLLIFPVFLSGAELPLAVLLEEAKFTEHVLGEQDRALELYSAILEARGNTRDPIWAEATKSAILVHQIRGERERSRQMAHTLAAVANEDLRPWRLWAEAFLDRTGRLPLQEAPWPDYEQLRYIVRSVNGSEIGFAHYWMAPAEHAGLPALELRSNLFLIINNSSNVSKLITKPVEQQWLPLAVSAKMESQLLPELHVEYDWNAFTSTATSRDREPVVIRLATNEATLDSEQFFFVPRLLNAETDPHVSLPFSSQGLLLVAGDLQFRGMQEIEWGGNTVLTEVWRGQLIVKGSWQQTFDIYIDPSPGRKPLKIHAEYFIMELLSADTRPGLHPYVVADTDTPYGFEVPANWFSYVATEPQTTTTSFVISSEGYGIGIFLSQRLSSDREELEQRVERDLQRLEQILPNYRIIERTVNVPGTTIADNETTTVIGTFVDRSILIREQRQYWIRGDTVYWLVQRAEDSQWDLVAPVFEGWRGSFHKVPTSK
ncbi:MAG: hypothetical protein LR015_10135 [Verrucomicrobia bacterium]|nr:hypothetical protein [Verrucomicrobiota bacterium]